MDRCDNEALLSKSLDGELAAEEQPRLDAHLQECSRCRELLRDLKAVEQELRSVPLPSPADWQECWQAVARALTTKAASGCFRQRRASSQCPCTDECQSKQPKKTGVSLRGGFASSAEFRTCEILLGYSW